MRRSVSPTPTIRPGRHNDYPQTGIFAAHVAIECARGGREFSNTSTHTPITPSSTGLAPLPILPAQSPFREDADDMAASNALAWFVLITGLVGVIVMGVVAIQRSLSER